MSFPRYPRYVASGVAWLGDIPAHWRVLPLKAVATCNDDVLPESTAEGTLIEYLEISGVEAGRGITQTETLTFGSAPSRARRVVHHGDVLISTVRTYLRAIATVANPPENLIASTGFAAIRPKAVQPGFLGHLLHCEYLISAVIARSVGISYPAINASDLMYLKGPFPPFEEQGAIAAFLDRETAKIDTLVEEQRRLIDLLKEKRQAVISRAVTKGLNPNVPTRDSGVEWLGLIPKHWDSGTLTRVADRVVVGIAEAATHAYADEGVAILRSTNIRAGKIVGEILYVTPEFAEGRATKLINAGDLVTVRTGNAGVTGLYSLSSGS